MPGLTIFMDGSHLENGATGYTAAKKGDNLERPQNPHGLGAGSLRRRMRSDCKGPPGSGIQKPCARHRHHLHGRPGSHLENDLRRSGTRPEIGDHGQETYRRPPSERARSQNRDSVVPKPPRSKGTRWLTSGPNSQLTSQMHTEWSGSLSGTRAAKSGRKSSPSRDPWPMSSAGFGEVGGGQGWANKRPRTASAALVEAGSHGGACQQAPCLPLLPTQDRTVLCVDRPDVGCWHKIETRLKSSLTQPGQGPHQDCGVRRRAVQSGDSRFPRYSRCRWQKT